MNKELTSLVERLDRIFPYLKMYDDGHYIYEGPKYTEESYCPPIDLTWYDIIEILQKNGLEIINIKMNAH